MKQKFELDAQDLADAIAQFTSRKYAIKETSKATVFLRYSERRGFTAEVSVDAR